jgi:hypothetical protein
VVDGQNGAFDPECVKARLSTPSSQIFPGRVSAQDALGRPRVMDDSRQFEMVRISDAMPEIVSEVQWREASEALLAKEKR